MVKVLAWTKEAWKDYLYWQGQDKKPLKRINKMVLDTKELHLKASESLSH